MYIIYIHRNWAIVGTNDPFTNFLSLVSCCVEIQVDFASSVYTVSEGDGVATVFLNKVGNNEIPVMVSVVTRTVDDTAEGIHMYVHIHVYTCM